MPSQNVKNLLKIILSGITDKDIEIEVKETDELILIHIKPNDTILRAIIVGKSGNTINAIRKIFESIARFREGKRIIIEVL